MSDESQPRHQDNNPVELEEDPLAELARIVAGEPEPDMPQAPALEQTNIASEEFQVPPSIDQQLDQIGQNLESALNDNMDELEELAHALPEEQDIATEEPAPEGSGLEQVAVEAPAQDEELAQTQEAIQEDDSFLDGLRSAIDADTSQLNTGNAHQPLEISEPVNFEDDLVSALNEEVAAANFQPDSGSQEGDLGEPATGEMPVPLESELEAAITAEIASADIESSQSASTETPSEIIETAPFPDKEDPVIASGEVPPETPEELPEDFSEDAVDATHHSLEDDLGAVFANEFEQILASDPNHMPASAEINPAQQTIAETDADDGLDFGKAFAEELGVDNLVETQGWNTSDENAANAAFAQAAQPSYSETTTDETAYATGNDPVHSRDVPGIDAGVFEPSEDVGGQGSKKYAIVAMVIALFAGAIAAGYGFLGDADGPISGDPQLVKANEEPFKVKPEDPGGRIAANQDKASYERVEGQDSNAVEQESLVSDTEEPATVDENQLVEIDDPETNATIKVDERLEPSQTPAVNQTSPEDLTPRVVQTVTVKPDGTIVTTPSVNPVRNVEEQVQNAVDVASNNAINLAEELATPKPVETITIQKPEAIDGAQTTGNLAVPLASPLPKPQPASPAPEPVEIAAVTPEPQPAPTARKSEWVVQVSSQRSPEAAQASYANLRSRFSELQGRAMSIQRANVNGSTFFRVRVQTESRSDATGLCNSLQASGGSCFVTR